MTIFWFSGTGNTKYVCDRLKRSLEARGWQARLAAIAGLDTGDRDRLIGESDTVFLAYPIYGSDPPDMMRQFVRDLPPGGGKPLGVICTQLAFSGDGASVFFGRLRRRGYRQKWAWQVTMPNNLCIPGSPFRQSADYRRHEQRYLTRARDKVERIADAVDTGRRRLGDHSPFHLLLGLSQRPAYRAFAMKSYARRLDVDAGACIGCGKCAAACPAGVLEMKDGCAVFVNRSDCQVCLRCLNFCPASAVTFGGRVRQPLYKGPTREMYRELFG